MNSLMLLLAQTQPAKIDPILYEILKALAPAITLALVGLLSAPIRAFLFYRTTEYDFDYDTQQGAATWDIQWENFRLTMRVAEVHNDHLAQVTFLKNRVEPGETIAVLKVSEKFHELFGGDIQIKLNSVIRVRSEPAGAPRRYSLRFVLRRR
jgi:hypothetical protein